MGEDGSSNFPCSFPSSNVALDNPRTQRVESSELNGIESESACISLQTAKPEIETNFAKNFDVSFVSSVSEASFGEDRVDLDQSSPQNPEVPKDLVGQGLDSNRNSMQTSLCDGFSFSMEQLACPVVIEIFCGSARLTASLKAIGFRDSFGVDHNLDKAVSAAKRLDLTLSSDQQILKQWMKSPVVVGVFLAPPCGTCSLARNIKLRDARGRPLHGPKPLRSTQWPEGLPGLKEKDRSRVSSANQLYNFLAELVDSAHELGIIVVVENPRSSLFWLTSFWKKVQAPMHFSAHQACAYGGSRPKWTVLAWNHSAFAIINKCCPGESECHRHKPWGLVHSESGTHFSTSEETAYPLGLTHAIARVFATILVSHGWVPPMEQLEQINESSLKSMRAVATSQPKAAKFPPVVREHKRVILISGPFQELNKAPVEPMQRLKSPWTVPTACRTDHKTLPTGAQLLRTTPLRSSGGVLETGTSEVGVFEQAWGIPFDPEEFILEAIRNGHPRLFARLVPKVLHEAIRKNFEADSMHALPRDRSRWFAKWTERAKHLTQADSGVKQALPVHAAKILAPKRLILFKEILEDLEYPDVGAFDELVNGTELVGEVPPYGIFEKAFKPAEKTVEQVSKASLSERLLSFYKCSSSGDGEIDEIVYNKTLEEVECGWAHGPIDIAQLPEGAVVSRRFGLRQPGKVRLIDDLSASGVNQTVQTTESPKPHSADFIAAMLLEVLKHSNGVPLMGRSFDLKSAYKQLAIARKSLSFAFVAVYNPKRSKAEVFQLLAAPFGATRSVFSFLRLSNALWYIGVKALNIIWSCFFDDYVVFARDEHTHNTNQTVSLLFNLLGWKFAEEGEKAESFSKEFGALGIRIILDDVCNGLVKFTNTEKRANELVSTINSILQKGSMTLLEAQKLRGRMQFMDGQLFGRLGRLCMREVTNHTCDLSSLKIRKRTADALNRFVVFLEHADPRRIHLSTDEVWHVYTDACYEPTATSWKCGLGGVLVGPNGVKAAFFSWSLDDDYMGILGAEIKKTIIFEAELLALVLAFSVWRDYVTAKSIICFVDNNSARDMAISGNGRNFTANSLIDFLLKLEMATCTTPWYTRIPTPSNIADDPSRGVVEALLAQKVSETSVQDGLREIMVALAEDTVKMGANF